MTTPSTTNKLLVYLTLTSEPHYKHYCASGECAKRHKLKTGPKQKGPAHYIIERAINRSEGWTTNYASAPKNAAPLRQTLELVELSIELTH